MHPDRDEPSWLWRGAGKPIGRRYDHGLASRRLAARAMHYRYDWREHDASGTRLSDHSSAAAKAHCSRLSV